MTRDQLRAIRHDMRSKGYYEAYAMHGDPARLIGGTLNKPVDYLQARATKYASHTQGVIFRKNRVLLTAPLAIYQEWRCLCDLRRQQKPPTQRITVKGITP